MKIIQLISFFLEIEQYCIALYDYDATCDEELSFLEGDILKVLRKEPHDVDDGWWEGELRGQRGLFPSLIVEPCAADGSPLTPQVTFQLINNFNVFFKLILLCLFEFYNSHFYLYFFFF